MIKKCEIWITNHSNNKTIECGSIKISLNEIDNEKLMHRNLYVVYEEDEHGTKLLSIEPIHQLDIIPTDIKPIITKNTLVVELNSQLKCKFCSYTKSDEKREIRIPIDVIEVDGKLYGVETEEYSIGLIDLSSVKVDHETKLLVRYKKLRTGIYAPIDLISAKTLEELDKLDQEYIAIDEKLKIECGEKCVNIEKFKELYQKWVEIPRKQGKLIIDEIVQKGFKIEKASCGITSVVSVVDPQGRWHGFNPWRKMLRGGYSLLGYAYTEFFKLTDIKTKLPREECEKRGRIRIYDHAIPVVIDGKVIFKTPDGDKLYPITPIDPSSVFLGHKYRVEYDVIERVVIAYVPNHTEKGNRAEYKILTGNSVTTIGKYVSTCEICGIKTYENYIFEEKTFRIISLNGRLYFDIDSQYDEIDVDEVRGDVEGKKHMLRLPSGLEVDIGRIDITTLNELIELEVKLDDPNEVMSEQMKVLNKHSD